jgi:hypothetical protein
MNKIIETEMGTFKVKAIKNREFNEWQVRVLKLSPGGKFIDLGDDVAYFGDDDQEDAIATMEHMAAQIEKNPQALRVESTIQEKAQSKKQQKYMGQVRKCQKTGKCTSKEVADTAKSMKKSDVKDFASTKHKTLPNKKKKKLKESTMDAQKKLSVQFINDICNKEYASAGSRLSGLVDEKIKTRIKRIASELEAENR